MKLQIKRSVVADSVQSQNVTASGQAKVPTESQMKFGELAVNYCNEDPSIFLLRDNGTPQGEVIEPYFKKNTLHLLGELL